MRPRDRGAKRLTTTDGVGERRQFCRAVAHYIERNPVYSGTERMAVAAPIIERQQSDSMPSFGKPGAESSHDSFSAAPIERVNDAGDLHAFERRQLNGGGVIR